MEGRSVITSVTIIALGTSRDDCINALDRLQFDIQETVAGAPWSVTEDDMEKNETPGLVLADDQGMSYAGKRTISFNGPFADIGIRQLHDGFQVQRSGENG